MADRKISEDSLCRISPKIRNGILSQCSPKSLPMFSQKGHLTSAISEALSLSSALITRMTLTIIFDDHLTIIISTLRVSSHQLQQVTLRSSEEESSSGADSEEHRTRHRVAYILSLPAVTQRFRRAWSYIVFKDSFMDDLQVKYYVFYDLAVLRKSKMRKKYKGFVNGRLHPSIGVDQCRQ